MRFWIVAAVGIATVVVCCAVRAGYGIFSDEMWAEAARAAVMLLAGAWTGARGDTRTIGMIFMFGGLLGVVGMLSQMPGLHIDSGSDVGLEDWLHYWIWVPQVTAPLLLVTAIFPDGRPAWPWLIWLSVLTIGCLAVVVATFNWPRGDGGVGGNPVALPAPIEDAAGFGSLFLLPASALLVLVSLLKRWSDGRRAALYPAAVLVVAVPFLLLDLATWFPAFHAAAIAVGGSPVGLSRFAAVRQDGPHADPPPG